MRLLSGLGIASKDSHEGNGVPKNLLNLLSLLTRDKKVLSIPNLAT